MTQDTQQTYSLVVRFPDDMRKAIQETAKADDRSVNGLIVAAVRRYLETVQADRRSRSGEIVYSVLPSGATVSEALAAGATQG